MDTIDFNVWNFFFTYVSSFRHCRAFIFRLLGSFPRTTTRIHLFWRVGYKHSGKPNFGRNLLRCQWNFNVSIYRSLIMALMSKIILPRVTSANILSFQIHFWHRFVSGITYYLSSTINPILYNLMSAKYRDAFRNTFCGPCFKGQGMHYWLSLTCNVILRLLCW